MTPKEYIEFAYTQLHAHGLTEWTVIVDDTVRAVGRCFSGQKKITLSRRYLYTCSEEQIKDTILHEIAHALVGAGHGHNEVWKAKAIELGAKPERCAAVSTKHKYVLTCPFCNRTYQKRSRRPVGRKYFCNGETYCKHESTECYWQEIDYAPRHS